MALLQSLPTIFCYFPVHLLCFSTLLGTQLYQSFILTKVAINALPRNPYIALQGSLFPVYFRIQSLFLVLVAITVPSRGIHSLIEHKADWIPLLIGGHAAALNLFLFGPRTGTAMMDVKQYGIENPPSKSGDTEQPSQDLIQLKKSFRRNHAASIHLNLICIITTLFYGWRLSSRFQ